MQEEVAELAIGSMPLAFGDIARDRYRRPSQLLAQALDLVPGKLSRGPINFCNELHGYLPNAQILERR